MTVLRDLLRMFLYTSIFERRMNVRNNSYFANNGEQVNDDQPAEL